MDRQTTRALQQVVSLDGWIGTFDADGTASVHADVVFRQGAFGEAPDALIRFKIALKRAEIVLRIPGQEPIAVVKESIERSTKNAAGQRKKSTQTSKKFSLASKLGLSRKPTASADADATYTLQSNEEFSFQEEVQTYLEQHFTTIDGHAAWEVKTASELGVAYLSSAPWDALEAPRMKVRRSADKGPDGSPPSLIIEVRCTREDIEILDLEQKQPEWTERFDRKKKAANIAAAEQLIKDELLKAGFLKVPELDEKHARLLIADKIIFEDK